MLRSVFPEIYGFLVPVIAVVRDLSGLIRTPSHPDMLKIRIIGFFLNKLL
jgi:hypothetical protein